jgi:hypothetical protein
MYADVNDVTTLGLDGRRRLRLAEGVGELFDTYIAP